MKLWKLTMVALVVVCGSPVLTAAASEGTAKEQAACRPDVSPLLPFNQSWIRQRSISQLPAGKSLEAEQGPAWLCW
jgi:hypothetical protein